MQFNAAAEAVCFKSGHDFKEFHVGKPFIPPGRTEILYPETKLMCRLCGMTPAHVFNYQVTRKKGKANARSAGGPPEAENPQD